MSTTDAIDSERREPLARALDRFAAVFGDGRLGVAELRRNLDAMMLETAPAEDVSVTEVVVGGVPALRVEAGPVSGDGVLVWFHGGGYVMGSPHGYRYAASELSRSARVPVIVPDYRLAPEHPFPAAVDDAAAVTAAVITEHGAHRTVLGGDSAGGGLTLAALLRLRENGDGMPAAAVAVSPLADFTATGDSVAANGESDPVITERSLRNLGGAYLRGTAPDHPLASPVFADLRDLPPILLLASDSEILLDDAVRLNRSIQAAGGRSVLSVYPDTCHAWTLFSDFLPQARRGVDEIGTFIDAALSPTAASGA
ncbi:alpha/beta hydrolase fold domain-containing protein [Gordonia sp. KTR9]|uniref:alpha/beta hydrolase fold domain-containing protein n=1 Tax=Gordonia sp. KTR9 TaxID=337191 RepID=UPI00027DE664|nr:alpha/beta hydrolase [Gordonia sp. KTR9]AFR49817.1 Alpha/beta hydrolase fold-3 domain protein [Gordonia sp. KTR9]